MYPETAGRGKAGPAPHSWVAVLGHIFFALRDQDSIEAMLGGEISAKWARTKAPLWYEELNR